MVHGMGGTEADWQTWVDVLTHLRPVAWRASAMSSFCQEWSLWPLQKLSAGCRFMNKDLRELSVARVCLKRSS